MTAPVTVIVDYDMKFYEQAPKLFPHSPGLKHLFEGNPQLVEVTAQRNSTLQGAYLILAARALGLDCGPMSGFDNANARVDEEFFAAGKPCFGYEVMSSLISFAILDTVIRVGCSLDFPVYRSTRRVSSCRVDGRY